MLSSDQVNQYRRQGYCVAHGFLGSAQVAELLADAQTICATATLANHDSTRMEMEPNQGPDGQKVRRLYEPCTHYPRFRALSDSAEVLNSVEQLLGPNLMFHYSKLNMKPPAIGSVVEWHQDLAYYPLTNRDSLAVLFYFDDADTTNGCLQVIPGQHLGGAMDHTLEGFFQGRITEPVDVCRAVPLAGKAGSVIFMNGMTPHASAPNTSSRPRRTLILSYRAADAFPIYIGDMTLSSEAHVRHVRGEQVRTARFSMSTFPIPRYPKTTKSLYELQELSHKEQGARAS
jgi:ectoine hydroxylase-related dioxygenase (phytanoyl-CoA dioxygenase family)